MVFSPLVAVGAVNTVPTIAGNYECYIWLVIGVVLFFVLNMFFIRGKDDTIRVFSHELNHAVVSLMIFKKVHSFHVESTSGMVYFTAGGRFSTVLITMASYCLPFFTYVLMIVRAAVLPDLSWVVDMLIGVTFGFYISVFCQQISSEESDISRFRLRLFPFWFIFTFIIFNIVIILYGLLPGKNVFLSFADTFVGYWHYIVAFINLLK